MISCTCTVQFSVYVIHCNGTLRPQILSCSWLTGNNAVRVIRTNFTSILIGTPIEVKIRLTIDIRMLFNWQPCAFHFFQEIWTSGLIYKGEYYLKDMSNTLRLALLYKYGGTYMDTDLLSLKSLPQGDFVTLQTRQILNNAVFTMRKPRHPFTELLLQDLVCSSTKLLPLSSEG